MRSASSSAAPGNRRPRRRPGENHANLLAASTIEFGRRGYAATQTSVIAKRAGVSQPNVYANFSSKRDLFLACLQNLLELLSSGPTGVSAAEAQNEAQVKPQHEYMGALSDEHTLLLYQAVACASDTSLKPDLLLLLHALRVQLGDERLSNALLRAADLLLDSSMPSLLSDL